MSSCPRLGIHQNEPRSTAVRSRPPALARLDRVSVRFRGAFAYIDAHLPDGEIMPLCRLRYGGSASIWGFAIYRASHDDYQTLPAHGARAGSPEDALDCACGSTSATPAGSKPSPIPDELTIMPTRGNFGLGRVSQFIGPYAGVDDGAGQ